MIELRRYLGLAILGALLGCAGNDGDRDPKMWPDRFGAAANEAQAQCPADTPDFRAGLEAVGVKQLAKARVIRANPPTPEIFYNDWTVAFLDAQGSPLADVQVASACVVMPVHSHSTRARAITPLMDPGTFQLEGLDLSMLGPWEVRLAINSPTVGGVADQFTKCDPDAFAAELIVLKTCIEEED